MTREIKRDHPRLCGEKAAGYRTRNGNPGSPPPMRGKAVWFELLAQIKRITPAYAGKSLPDPELPDSQQGSPPPMRGKVEYLP